MWWLRAEALAVLGCWLAAVGVFIHTWREVDLRYWFFYDDSHTGLGELAGVHDPRLCCHRNSALQSEQATPASLHNVSDPIDPPTRGS